ncbi:MAG: ammonium transporter [Deltaproteobacteria bacterium]|nr:ammonium transporter [Deltaproteobacteria bacterium]
MDSGDTAWILTSSALVLMMTVPGLAFFYGGLVRGKNVLSTLMHSFVMMGIVSVSWILCGYSIAFGPDVAGLFGNPLTHLGLKGIGPNDVSGSIPTYAFVVFQLMFAIITPALISGAIAERMKFKAYLLFMILWATFIYAPLCHWVWGGGWIAEKWGALDFAGGTVVHISSGVSALVAAILLGRRRGHGSEPMPPHNLAYSVLGAGLLWVGWFGFNSGSALASNSLAATAFITTNTATGAAVLGWMFTEWIHRGKPTMLGVASGAVAGLVAITPAAGFVSPMAAMLIGVVAGGLCYGAVNLKARFGYDDALDVVGVHGVGGTWGALATGVFAWTAMNDGGSNGLIHGNPGLLLTQLKAVLATWIFCGVGTFVLLKITDMIVGLRVNDEDEVMGLDITQHSEQAYTGAGFGGSVMGMVGSHQPSVEKPAALGIPARSTP